MAVLSQGDFSGLLGPQLLGIAVIFAGRFGAGLVVWYLLKLALGIHVSEEQEYQGADISEGGLEAYPAFSKIS